MCFVAVKLCIFQVLQTIAEGIGEDTNYILGFLPNSENKTASMIHSGSNMVHSYCEET